MKLKRNTHEDHNLMGKTDKLEPTCATKLAAGERHRPVLPVGYWRCEHLQEKMGTITNKEKNGTLHTCYS